MTTKTILYIIIVPLSIWGIDCLDINRFLKKNRYYQARLFYFMLSMGLSYLVVNFLYDFFTYSKFL
ncbi:MAG: DUF1146 domain-containing protein [Bacilli bacterium]|nr:DUF1146 domain-containing protein [Bacilli bacterium]